MRYAVVQMCAKPVIVNDMYDIPHPCPWDRVADQHVLRAAEPGDMVTLDEDTVVFVLK